MSTFTQEQRFCSFQSPLGENTLLLLRMRAVERVSGLFSAVLDLESERDDIDPHEIVGKGAAVAIETAGGDKRFLHGIVTRFTQGGRDARLVSYRAELHSWLWFHTRNSNCRIFQDMSVPDIVAEVLQGRDLEFQLQGSYEPRTYVVQYRESDYAFVSRLLEEAGIFHFVRHEEDRHVVVCTDADAMKDLPGCPGQDQVDYQSDTGQTGRDVVTGWTIHQELHAGKVALKDFNFEDPGNPLEVKKTTTDAIGDNATLEVYDYHPGRYPATGRGEPIALVRMQERETAGVRVLGQATCRAFSAGHTFVLQQHYRADWNDQKYMLLSVEHLVSQPSALRSDTGEQSTYENAFTAIAAALPFRPACTTPKPYVRGPQTALVVGPAGEEIHVDKYGRVKVQFHWDRQGNKDDKSSCWIRVAQAWAGKQWGAVAHPRIGDEVIVEHLEGDPDQPIITGCVYNAQQMPPYALPANKTQTGIKTRSSPGGAASNFNEIRFEDKKGSEEVYIQAEKNKKVLVKNDRTENVGNDETITIGHDRKEDVGNDETITIGNNRTENVGNDETITIGNNRTETVGANETITIGGSRSENVGSTETVAIGAARTHLVGANDSQTIGGAQEVTIGGLRALTIGGADAVTIGGSRTTNVGGDESHKVGKGRTLEIEQNDQIKIGKSLAIDVGEQIVIKTGDAKIIMKKDGSISIEGKDIKIKGSGKVVVDASSDVKLKGAKILQN